MVVGHLLVIYQQGHIREELPAPVKGRYLGRQVEDHRSGLRHVGGQKPAVRPGIGQQLFLIEGLCVVQRLFRRVAEDAVGLPLEGGQVVEPGRCLFLLFTGDGSADCLRAGTGRPQGLRLLRGGDLLRHRLGPAASAPPKVRRTWWYFSLRNIVILLSRSTSMARVGVWTRPTFRVRW